MTGVRRALPAHATAAVAPTLDTAWLIRRSTTMKWITRERAKVDRIACPWLMSRFIDPEPAFLYVPADQVRSEAAARGAIPYDMPDVEIGHQSPLCNFGAL